MVYGGLDHLSIFMSWIFCRNRCHLLVILC